MVNPKHTIRKTLGEGLSHVATISILDGIGVNGANLMRQREWQTTRRKGAGIRNWFHAAGEATAGAFVGEAAQWALPATFKALYHSKTPLEYMRFLPGVVLDGANLVASFVVFAAIKNPLAAAAVKSGINALENTAIDGVGRVTEKVHGATIGKLRRGKN